MCIILKNTKPEYAVILTLAVAAIVLLMCVNQIRAVLDALKELMNQANIDNEQIKLVLKIVGVSYITDFGSQICKDAGENSMGEKINLAGKIFILFLTTPLIISILKMTNQLF